MKNFLKLFLLVIFILTNSTSCSAIKPEKRKNGYPVDKETERRMKRGKLTGEGGLKLFSSGTSERQGSGAGSGVGVNTFLWRASLDTIDFLPFSTIDPHGGVILTDWYEDPEAKGERIKLNVLVLGTVLRVDALKITIFKEVKDKNGDWVSSPVSADTARELEDTILTRARELRIEHAGRN